MKESTFALNEDLKYSESTLKIAKMWGCFENPFVNDTSLDPRPLPSLHMRRRYSALSYWPFGVAKGTGASFKFKLIDKLTPPYKRSADDSIKCRCAHSGMTGHVGSFQTPGVCPASVSLPFFLAPPRSFTRAIFHADMDSCYSFFAPKPHGNACYAG